jgi:hypothetical protein
MTKTKDLRSNGKEHDSEDGSLDDIDSDKEMGESENDQDSVTMGSFVKVEREKSENADNSGGIPEDTDEPDYYDIDVLAWDFQVSPHLLQTEKAGKCIVYSPKLSTLANSDVVAFSTVDQNLQV